MIALIRAVMMFAAGGYAGYLTGNIAASVSIVTVAFLAGSLNEIKSVFFPKTAEENRRCTHEWRDFPAYGPAAVKCVACGEWAVVMDTQ